VESQSGEPEWRARVMSEGEDESESESERQGEDESEGGKRQWRATGGKPRKKMTTPPG
jgi:hypothetical protein